MRGFQASIILFFSVSAFAQTGAQFADCYNFVAGNISPTLGYGGGDASLDFNSRLQSVQACQLVQSEACVENAAGSQNYIFANRLQAANKCQQDAARPYTAVTENDCVEYVIANSSDQNELTAARQACTHNQTNAPPPASKFQLQECYDYSVHVTQEYQDCLNSNFRVVAAARDLSLNTCSDGLGEYFAPAFGQCVRGNFDAIARSMGPAGVYLNACYNDTQHINPAFTTCVRANFQNIQKAQ